MENTFKHTFLGKKTEELISKVKQEITTYNDDKELKNVLANISSTVESDYNSLLSQCEKNELLTTLYGKLDECEEQVSQYFLNNKMNTKELFFDIFELKSMLHVYIN